MVGNGGSLVKTKLGISVLTRPAAQQKYSNVFQTICQDRIWKSYGSLKQKHWQHWQGRCYEAPWIGLHDYERTRKHLLIFISGAIFPHRDIQTGMSHPDHYQIANTFTRCESKRRDRHIASDHHPSTGI